MRKYIFLVVGMLMTISAIYSQGIVVIPENFDDATVTFSSTPANGWSKDSIYSTSSPYSYRGMVPHIVGDSIVLTTPTYDFHTNNCEFVQLRFKHICKISPSDRVRIEYKRSGEGWNPLPATAYKGKASNYISTGFNAASYSDWQAGDSTAMPAQSWWKEETFEIGFEVGLDNAAQFRFILVHGTAPYTQISYGWLLDDFEITAAPFEVRSPVVEFISPLIKDTVFGTGPWEINAKVRTSTPARIEHPSLIYTATYNGVVTTTDTILMTMVRGDSLWKATIPQFIAGTMVSYSITGRDTTGNTSTAVSAYIVAVGESSIVIVGPGTVTDTWIPICTQVTYYWGWSRNLYLASELGTTVSGGIISRLAWETPAATTASYTLNNQICYLQAVDDVALNGTYVDPLTTPGVEQVYSGSIDLAAGWCEVIFDKPFFLPAGKNLVVHWYYLHGVNPPSAISFLKTNTSVVRNSDKPLTSNTGFNQVGSNNMYYANARFTFTGASGSDAASVYAIEINDTMPVAPGLQLPVISTIKNKGTNNLTSVKIYHSVNGGAPQLYNWSGNLPWDFNSTDTLGYYTPSLNKRDTITVWVELPNGIVDTISWDDTLSRIIFGSSDILMSFLYVSPTDTVYTTGPHTIEASISTLSGSPLGTIPLCVAATNEGTTIYDTINMSFDVTRNRWRCVIPNYLFGSDVSYRITLTDFLNNVVSIADSFHIQRMAGMGSSNPTDSLQVGSSLTGGNCTYPFCVNADSTMSRSLYLSSELEGTDENLIISGIAFYNPSYNVAQVRINQQCYLKAVNLTALTATTTIDPEADGATLVYTGGWTTYLGWNKFIFDRPFVLPAGSNLMVYWMDRNATCNNSAIVYWSQTTSGTTRQETHYWNWNCNSTNKGTSTAYSTTMFYFGGGMALDDSNSVALEEINTPLKGGVTAGTPTDVTVTIRNRGRNNLTSCDIDWTLNGLPQPTYHYTGGNLPEDFVEMLTIGSYIPVYGQTDNITIWVSMPNGIIDTTTYDDTLKTYTMACSAGGMSGDYIIGASASAQFTTLDAALAMLGECGATGTVRFLLENGTYTGTANLSSIAGMIGSGNSFELTSVSGNAQGVIIKSSNIGIILGNNRNVVIKNLTIDVTGGTYGIQFTNACTNITIRDCRILVDTVTTSSATAPIYKASAGISDSIFIIHNELVGGYYGCYFYGGTSNSLYGTNVVLDSNTFISQYYYTTYFYYTDIISCSYNTILTRTANTSAYWYGLFMYYTNGNFVGNRIIQRSTAITYPYGFYAYYLNYYPTPNLDTALIANNEVILYTSNAGFFLSYAHAKMINNSIHVAGSGAGKGIYLQNLAADVVTIKNNNITMRNPDAYPIYLTGTTNIAQYDIDYNNLYAPNYVGYAGANVATMAIWQQIVPTDRHSVRVLPSFIDSSTSLELSTYNGLLCWLHPDVTNDINGTTRPSMTAMGAYTYQPVQQDLMLMEITPWNEEIVQDEDLSVNVNVINIGSVPITTAVLGWSINGVTQPSTITWNPSPTVAPYDQRSLFIGTFRASNAGTFNVKVWIESINGQPDMATWNDTISAAAYVHPLAEFVAPFVPDTIFSLSFNVNALIRTGTDAPTSAPKITLQSIVNGSASIVFYDTINMIQRNNGIWQAQIPKQYYNTTVIYSLTVFDTVNNSITIVDTTFIRYVSATGDSLRIVGTGTGTTAYSPYYSANDRGWSRAIYMGWELHPQTQGGYISSIAYFNTSATPSIVDSLSMYFRAVSDTAITSGGYQDPVSDGATLVWGESTGVAVNGWNTFALHKPFYLPAGYNLMVYWNNRDGSSASNGTAPYWQYTLVSGKNIRSYASGTTFPTTTNISIDGYRPNARFVFTASNEQYAGYDLGLLAITEPVTVSTGSACSNDYTPLKVVLANLGENDYDFSVNGVTLSVEVGGAIAYTETKTLSSGVLRSGMIDTVEITAMFPVYTPGQYDIKIWLTSAIDNVVYDDTISGTYISARLGLPIDENFSGAFPSEFVARGINSSYNWEIISQGTGADAAVVPVFGSGMLSFSGGKGAAVQLSTRQLELRGTILPTLEFWYFHDIIPSEDYTDVRITLNGGASYITLFSLTKYNPVYGWKQYSVDLTPYINGQCINIVFETMNTSAGITQYIDRILINSQPDLAVSKVDLPVQSACDLSAAELQVIMSTMTNQAIDLSQFSTSLAVEIPGYQSLAPLPLQKRIDGNSSDTIYIPVPGLPSGQYTVKAYLTLPVDNLSGNDTAYYVVNIQPALSVSIQPESTPANCLTGELTVNPTITLHNTGNLDLSNIELILQVDTGDNITGVYALLRETCAGTLAARSDSTYMFTSSYTVPWNARYDVRATVYLNCDSVLVHGTSMLTECVDTKDLHIISIDNPSGANDIAGSSIQVTATLHNRSDHDEFTQANITALVTNSQGVQTEKFTETKTVGILATTSHTFAASYTVPNDSVYYLTVYTDHYDNYSYNDTMTIRRETLSVDVETLKSVDGFTLYQNIPNPANNSTRIDYSIPETGEVVFNLHSVSGQLLYSKTTEAASGKQSLELNTSTFSAGIYFYSIEYKGQRLVKRLMISD